MAHLNTLQAGERAALAKKLLAEISAASACPLNADKKVAYDRQLKSQERLPIPDDEAQKRGLELVQDVLQDEIEKATTPDEQRALADQLIRTGLDNSRFC